MSSDFSMFRLLRILQHLLKPYEVLKLRVKHKVTATD
jgi:hypothetical protein